MATSILGWRIPKDRRAWRATIHGGHKESDATEQLSIARQRSLSPLKWTYKKCYREFPKLKKKKKLTDKKKTQESKNLMGKRKQDTP